MHDDLIFILHFARLKIMLEIITSNRFGSVFMAASDADTFLMLAKYD